MASLTGAHLFIRCLKQEGIEKVFTIVGDTILPLVNAAAEEGIEFIDTRHEGAALHMADGYARITGRPAVGMFTGGPGFSNAISALPAVFTSESPVIFIAGCAELPEKGMTTFQEIDQTAMAAPVTKGSWLIHDRKRIPEFVATAFRTAMSGRPGPVHLTLPMDVQEQEISEDELPRYLPREYRSQGRSQGDPALIEEAAALLSGAKRPVIIAGNPARYSVAEEQLQSLAEATGIPVFTVEQARGLLDDEHPLCFGYADGALNPPARRFSEADVVLLLGKRLDHRYRYGDIFSPAAQIIQADPSPAEIGRNRGVAVGLLGDLGALVDQLTAAIKPGSRDGIASWVDQLREDRSAWMQEMRDKAGGEPMHPMDVYSRVEHLIDRDTVIVFDGGDYVQWGRGYVKARRPGHFIRLGPLSHLGASIPYGMAAKLAYPGSKVLVFIGDGAFGFYAMEYDTCMRHNLAITTVMGNDHTWGIDKTFQLAYFNRAVATDLRSVRYDKLVETLGGYSEYAQTPEEVAPAVERALASGRPSLVNVAIRSEPSPLAAAMIARRAGR
ncbi:MAG: thiamine pyrophosphate-binding protein [Dehalococcoidia bacterium]|jgi:acetolactate synthase-1/2/3 large subunit|nr:thiamine pyrophosphate-binding protein [Dehalococcoidia bacterium]